MKLFRRGLAVLFFTSFVFSFSNTINAATISVIAPNSTFTVDQIISKLISGSIITSNQIDKVRSLFDGRITPIIPATAKSIGKATLKLSYDSLKNESSLDGSQDVYITAGTNDILVSGVYLGLNEKTGIQTPHGIIPNSTKYTWGGNSGTTKESLTDANGNSLTVWRVRAGQTGYFTTKISTSPSQMYAGVYTASLSNYFNLTTLSNGIFNYTAINFTPDPSSESDKVVVVGEKVVPSISISDSSGNQGITVKVGDTFKISGTPQNIQGLSYYAGAGNPPNGYYNRAFVFDPIFDNSCSNNDASNSVWSISCTAKTAGSGNLHVEIYKNGQTYKSNVVTVTVLPTIQPSSLITSPKASSTVLVGNVSFTATASGGTGSYKYIWDFGDGGGSSSMNFEGSSQTTAHYFNTPGLFTTNLSVIDSKGNKASAQFVVVKVVSGPSIGQCYSATPTDYPACCDINNDSNSKSIWQSAAGNWSKFPKMCNQYPGYTVTPSSTITPPPLGQISYNTKSLNQTLKQGQSGDQVATLQTALQQAGVYSGPITGFFGDLTKKAVAAFQQANALEAIGEVGPKTRELLNSLKMNIVPSF